MKKLTSGGLQKYKISVIFCVLCLIVGDTFFTVVVFDWVYWLGLLGLLLLMFLFRIRKGVTLFGGFFMLTLVPLIFALGAKTIAEKLAMWAYLFFLVEVIYQLKEFWRSGKSLE